MLGVAAAALPVTAGPAVASTGAVASTVPAVTPTTGTPTPTASASPIPTRAVLTVRPAITVPGPKKNVPWPKRGQARLEAAGIGLIGRSGGSASVPIASVTKVMTAYTVLRDHPLAAGAQGPRIRVLKREADSYARRRAAGESLVRVKAGQRITQRQALQALLLASGNNMADILARWDAGSRRAFIARMNANARRLGMTRTRYADASGLDARSRSTATDLLKLAPAAMADPTFAQIVRQTRATIPHNRLKNTNRLLGRYGVIGIKTGSTRAAGGCLLFATEKQVGGRTVRVYGVVLGAPGPKILTNAFTSSEKLVVAARRVLTTSTLLPAGRTVATLTSTDGTPLRVVLARPLVVPGWAGLTYRLSLPSRLAPGVAPATMLARSAAGSVSVPLRAVPVQRPVATPSTGPSVTPSATVTPSPTVTPSSTATASPTVTASPTGPPPTTMAA